MNKDRLDPDPFAIASIVMAGAALLLNLEQKIEARKAAQRAQKAEAATSDARVRLARLNDALERLADFWQWFSTNGEYVFDQPGTQIGYGEAKKLFLSDEYAEFNDRFDDALQKIGVINRELHGLDLSALTLTQEIKSQLRAKITDLRNGLFSMMNPAIDIREKLSAVTSIVEVGRAFVREVGAAVAFQSKGTTRGNGSMGIA